MPTSYPNTLDFSNIAHQSDASDAFVALPVHILTTHVLTSGNLPDPSDLARLRAVSREMRDAVAATGREVYDLGAEKAIQLGDLSGMQLMLVRDDLDDDPNRLCRLAAEEGQLEILKWLRANDFRWDSRTCQWAAKCGHLEVLQWARANGCPWDEWTCTGAAEGGHLDVLQWARENGCPWNWLTCAYAARVGHLEMLQWARANGCPWNGCTCAYAKSNRHFELLTWAKANDAPEA